jgi:hypothetical protein
MYYYKITYTISTYALNEAQSQYFPGAQFRGVQKVYNYWFTGQNTQILSYEQSYNNQYIKNPAPSLVDNNNVTINGFCSFIDGYDENYQYNNDCRYNVTSSNTNYDILFSPTIEGGCGINTSNQCVFINPDLNQRYYYDSNNNKFAKVNSNNRYEIIESSCSYDEIDATSGTFTFDLSLWSNNEITLTKYNNNYYTICSTVY